MSEGMLGVSLRAVRGPINTLMERLAGPEGELWLERLNSFNRGEMGFKISRILRVVLLHSLSGGPLINKLKRNGYYVSPDAADLMKHRDCVSPLTGSCKVVIIDGRAYTGDNRTSGKIRSEARQMGWEEPNASLAADLRVAISDDEMKHMGLTSLAVMHKPILNERSIPRILGIEAAGDGNSLVAYNGSDDVDWRPHVGFVFIVPEKQ